MPNALGPEQIRGRFAGRAVRFSALALGCEKFDGTSPRACGVRGHFDESVFAVEPHGLVAGRPAL
jgi:hypothetical protein